MKNGDAILTITSSFLLFLLKKVVKNDKNVIAMNVAVIASDSVVTERSQKARVRYVLLSKNKIEKSLANRMSARLFYKPEA
jgi:hypothetical protein